MHGSEEHEELDGDDGLAEDVPLQQQNRGDAEHPGEDEQGDAADEPQPRPWLVDPRDLGEVCHFSLAWTVR